MKIFENIIVKFKSSPNDHFLIDTTEDLNDFDDLEVSTSLQAGYATKDGLQLKITTIINAILTHEAKHFLMTRRFVDVAVKSDVNNPKNCCNSKEYGRIRSILIKEKIVRTVLEPSGKNAGVYEVIHEDLLGYLNKIHDEDYYNIQKKEVMDYALSKELQEVTRDMEKGKEAREKALEMRKNKDKLKKFKENMRKGIENE